MPAFGDNLQLAAQSHKKATDKFLRARVFDSTDTEIAGSPVAMAHVTEGLYTNNALFMPNLPAVHAVYEAFNDALFTIPSTDHLPGTETFERNQTVVQSTISRTEPIVATIKDASLTMSVDSDPVISAKIEETKLKATVLDDNDVEGTVDETALKGEIKDC